MHHIASVQLRLLGEGKAVELARRALTAFTSPDISIAIQRSVDRQGHHSATAFGTLLINMSSESVAGDRMVLALTTDQIRIIQEALSRMQQQGDAAAQSPELESVRWLLTVNEQGVAFE
jgi:hypothetical protein